MTAIMAPALPAGIARHFGATPERCAFVAKVQNAIFRVSGGAQDTILRLTPRTHRSSAQVMAEIDFLRHVHAEGVPVCAPIPTVDGDWTVQGVLEDGQPVTAVAFTLAPGDIGAQAHWHAATFRAWGELLGRLHLAALSYEAPPNAPQRHGWVKNAFDLESVDSGEGADTGTAALHLLELESELQNALPQSHDSFGLIHSDLHLWNFAVQSAPASGGAGPLLTAFDFDNAEYHWFLADIATAVFEAATCAFQTLPRQEFIADFLSHLLAGYGKHRTLSFCQLRQLPQLIRLRQIRIFFVLSHRWRDRLRAQTLGPFQQRFFNDLRDSVVHNRPFMEAATLQRVLSQAKACEGCVDMCEF
ncbi:hypothetical protein DB346_02625 [Verrucomicrobia bacterium LW23]|nr:hypothetical protein DB346_04030 [Verrucomicrobia bacterium LW23]PTY04343.1 hypothetical protein DB346_02625 [Verrucomicrobia bacterium LW23]